MLTKINLPTKSINHQKSQTVPIYSTIHKIKLTVTDWSGCDDDDLFASLDVVWDAHTEDCPSKIHLDCLTVVHVVRNIQEVLHRRVSLAVLQGFNLAVRWLVLDHHHLRCLSDWVAVSIHKNYWSWWRGWNAAPKAPPTPSTSTKL